MNCPLATSRFLMRTLHQVHRRSGRSGEDASEAAMAGHSHRASRTLSTDRSHDPHTKNIFFVAMQIKKIVV